MTFRPPLITRQEPVNRAPEFQQSNLLETTLRSKDALPFRQQDWPNPRGPEFPSILRTWTDSYKLMLIGKDKFPNRQSDWPNPLGPEFAVALRTWTDSYKLGLIGKDALPSRQRDWPNPRAPAVDTRSDQQGRNMSLSQVIVQPFAALDWPNPRGAQVPVIQQQDVNFALTQVVPAPFSLADWPNPVSGHGWAQWDGVQTPLPLTEVPTPKPTPTPTVTVQGGGTSRLKRTLPEYYSRQFFGRDVQLPQDDIAHQVAEQVLEQAEGVLEDLDTDPAYDELLNTVDQLARIVSAHIETRSVYDAIEGVRASVQAKKDAEIRELVLAAEEEGEVKEIMELL